MQSVSPSDLAKLSNPFSAFFLWASGSSREILKKCPDMERNRLIMIGVFVFLTSLFAFCTATYAFFLIFKDIKIAILGGFLWACLIFNLDRFLVSTTTLKTNGEEYIIRKRSFLPRVFLAGMIGTLISIPFQLAIFGEEINYDIKTMIAEEKTKVRYESNNERAQIQQRREEEKRRIALEYEEHAQQMMKQSQSAIARKRDLIDSYKKEIDQFEKEITCETNGTCGTRTKTCRSVCEELKKRKQETEHKRDQAMTDLSSLEKEIQESVKPINSEMQDHLSRIEDDLQKEIRALEEASSTLISTIDQKYPTSLLTHYKALGRLQKADADIWYGSWFLIVFFMFLETAPVLAKVLSSSGLHDLFVHRERMEIETQTKEEQIKLKTQLAQEQTKRAGEEAKSKNEWATFQEAYTTFLSHFRQSIEEQGKKILKEWQSNAKADPHIQKIDSRYQEYFDQFLGLFKEFFESKRASNPLPTVYVTIAEHPSVEYPSTESPATKASSVKPPPEKTKHWEWIKEHVGKEAIKEIISKMLTSLGSNFFLSSGLFSSGIMVTAIARFQENGVYLLPVLLLVIVLIYRWLNRKKTIPNQSTEKVSANEI